MIGFVQGEVLFSDGQELILRTLSGVGYQLHFSRVLAEGQPAFIYVSHVVRENAVDLFGFENLRAKKLFELLLQVRGVGPKSAYALMTALPMSQIIEAIQTENKKALTKAPGVGDKAASQMILDLQKKILRVNMYTTRTSSGVNIASDKVPSIGQLDFLESEASENIELPSGEYSSHHVLEDALMACRELGFKDEKIIPIAQKVLRENQLTKPEQLVHLVLKGLA
jgi:holliday junction DNA helicase RuvA